jgi:glucosyl-dolichyl phosphate glucuronosyltransferase
VHRSSIQSLNVLLGFNEVNVRNVSVVICAYTEARWDQVCAAVESVRKQSYPSAKTIVVVDHNPALFTRMTAAMPDVTVVENQGARGLSGARNTGLAIADGEIVAFLDDDAVADPDWLKFVCEAYADTSVIGVGGLTLPHWEKKRPSWLPEEFYWVIGCNYTGMRCSGTPVRNLLGANMSFRRDAFEIVKGFRSGIGRTAAQKMPLGCEETEFCIELIRRSPGAVLVMEDRAVVSHSVPDVRCRIPYFVSRCYAEGISKARVAANVGQRPALSSERSYAMRVLPRGVAVGALDALRGDPAGLGRAAVIVLGLSVTMAGYAAGRIKRH